MSNTNTQKDKLISYAYTYNSSLKLLARIYALKKKGTFEEEKVLRNNRRLNIVISEEPMWLIENTGMFILKHGEIIKNRDFDKVIDMDFEDEKKLYKNTEDGSASKHTNNSMKGKIDFIKKVFINATNKERECMMNAVVDMLSSYCKYALHVKQYGIQHGQ